MTQKESAPMDNVAERIHPLDGRVFGSNGVLLQPFDFFERVSLRAEEAAIDGINKALDLKLPREPRTSATRELSELGNLSVLWIGPDEWLVVAPDGTGLVDKINSVSKGLYSAVAINHRNTSITVSGKNAKLALNAGCPQDLSQNAFPIGCCARTIIGKAEVVLWRIGEDAFHVECWRSFSDYVWKYLVDSARSV
jgi:sarcosine oxidase subunit gamma